jgi:tetratricopeptide (TPR) repeat protein
MNAPPAWPVEDDPEAALAALEECLSRNPADFAARLRIQTLCERLYRFDESLQHAREARKLEPANPTPLVNAAAMMYRRARFGEALALLREADPDKGGPEALIRTAEVSERADQFDAALEYAHTALRLAADHPRAVRLIAHVERRQGRLADALCRLESALNTGAHPDRWRLLYELAAVRDRLDDFTGAFAAMTEAKRLLAGTARTFAEPAVRVWSRQQQVIQQTSAADYRRWAEQAAPLTKRRIVVLAGHPRSGTTVLEQQLATSPDAIHTDESGVFNREFATGLLHHASGPATLALDHWRGWTTEELAAGRDTFWHLTEATLGETVGSRLLIEKDPLRTLDLPLFIRLFPESSILMPLRHPCDIALSVWMTLVPLHRESWSASSLPAAFESVAHTLSCWRVLRERLSQSLREVRYEQFVANPQRELAELRSFLGLASTTQLRDSNTRGISTPSYLEAGNAVHSRSANRWRNYSEQLLPHASPYRDLFREFGYELD